MPSPSRAFSASQGKDVRQELAESVVFPAHSTGTHRKHTGRWKQYSNQNFLRFFPYDFRPFPIGKHRQLAGIHRKKSKKLPAGILLPFPRNFRCFPTGYGDFSASFLQDPAGYGGRNLRSGLIIVSVVKGEKIIYLMTQFL